MTKEELVNAKHELDQNLAYLITEFSKETGFSISYVRIDAIELTTKTDNKRTFVHSVSCQVEI